MERKDKASIFAVVSTSICAIIWNILLFVDLYYGYSNNVSFVLHIVCHCLGHLCYCLDYEIFKIKKEQNRVNPVFVHKEVRHEQSRI